MPPRFSRLDDWLAWLETLHPRAIDLGLERVRVVAGRLDLLRPGVPVVTVAGTNGKGSVTALLDSLLRAHGLRTALYTSPHILRFSERIRVDGREAADADIVRALAVVDAARGDISLTYFEFTTLAAFVLFREAAPAVWILEIGLGGRLDAVNVIDPDVAVLTAVGLDHREWLGDTREDIGREKAGVFRHGCPAVIGDAEPPASVLAAVAATGARAVLAGRDFAVAGTCDATGTAVEGTGVDEAGAISAGAIGAGATGWAWRGQGRCGLVACGALPYPPLALANAATALQALHCLPFPVDAVAVRRGLAGVQLAGRNQRLQYRGRTVLVDVGHNAHALRFLRQELPRHGVGERFRIVLGMLGDKDIEDAVRVLEPLAEAWHIAPLPTPRSADTGRLAQAIAACGNRPVHACADIDAALSSALDAADALPVLVVGSFYTVAAALAALSPAAGRD